jgi:hypothetical protein
MLRELRERGWMEPLLVSVSVVIELLPDPKLHVLNWLLDRI